MIELLARGRNRVVTQNVSPNERVLQVSQLFSSLDAELVASLARASVRSHYERGDYLWRAKSPATHFTIIASGLVKIARTAADGSEVIVALFGPRESIGDVAVLQSKPYPADAVAVSDSVDVLRIDAPVVQAAMATHPSLLAAMNASLIEHTQALQEKIRIMSAGTVPKRLATLLLHLASRFGDELEDGTTFIPLVLSRTECARLIGATVETTIRTFSRWQHDALVDTTPEGFALRDVKRLEQVTAE
jgi:CRP-like cAMP-binding protein